MGIWGSAKIPEGTYSSLATGETPSPWAIRRHPTCADGVLQLPKDIQTGQDLYLNSVKKYGPREYVGVRKIIDGQRSPTFTFITYEQEFEIVKNFGAGLVLRGVKTETPVCIFSENRPEWIYTIDASYLYGYTLVALYDTFTSDSLQFSIENSQTEHLIVSGKNVARLMSLKDDFVKRFKVIIVLDELTENDIIFKDRANRLGVDVLTFNELITIGSAASNVPFAKIDPEQLSYICYSSGTTGFPKGVMISHRCFITNLISISVEGAPTTFDVHLCYLPLCHVFERMATSCILRGGGKVGTSSNDVRLLTQDLKALKPTVMIVVPRVVQRINDGVENLLSKSFVKRVVFNTAWYLKRFLLDHEIGTGLLDSFVFNNVKEMFGGELTMIVNGGAALPSDLHERVQVMLGWPVRTGYGLSEGGSGNVLCPTKLQHIKYGTSGYPLRNVELRIEPVADFTEPGVGEILMGGSGLCSGYLNDPQATAELFTDETHQWIHTGDIGRFDEDNALVIVDRMRSIFKLSQGEYVAGDLLATFFEAAELIDQIFVYGDSSRRYLIGIVIPNRVTVAARLGKKSLSPTEFEEECQTEGLKSAIMGQITEISNAKKLLGYQRLNSIALVNDEWTVENGVLSPTYKPKRKVLYDRFRPIIEKLYAQP